MRAARFQLHDDAVNFKFQYFESFVTTYASQILVPRFGRV